MLIALGSNLGSKAGDPAGTLKAALQAFSQNGLRLRRVSRFFATPCFPAGTGPDYANACAEVVGPGSAPDCLAILHRIEADFEREREVRWGSRTLDLDMLSFGDMVSPDPPTFKHWQNLPLQQQMTSSPDQLILPHPRMHERAFVLVPLCDIAPDWRHPVLRKTVREMTDALPEDLRRDMTAL
ncbi:2-amino-4-hydroxy-6-hydroxymethyldihydropteridine diphosphokinase [Pacificoceanicola onchidii]|uniref:2-amino-4-hydroxy-6- hydroxymethyldihydropteridine diphosphokinase n=1 Tax=Pacificoceanicola onchidii TaxID=2562685 RepID=UPI001F0D8F90|nr:2-amino-4-hydroxy-6-hydroxymethyldihydropteridine diphosphokinase [Pacificoceanicola onchidii]